MNNFLQFLIGLVATFIGMWFVVPILLFLIRKFGLYTVVQEGTCQVFVLFGKVVGIFKRTRVSFSSCQTWSQGISGELVWFPPNPGYADGSTISTQQPCQL